MSMASNHHLAEIERWLSPPDCSVNANLARKHHHPGTGTWLLDYPAFQEWTIGTRRHLWLNGPAGAGKTILSTMILDHLLQTGTHTLLAFFFDFNDPKKQRMENLLRSLAVQLYLTRNETVKSLDSLFASHDSGRRQPDMNTLAACVDTMVEVTDEVVIILDALDECVTRDELLQWIGSLKSSNAQLIMTSRPDADFRSSIPHLLGQHNCVSLDKKAVDADIRAYVIAVLEQKPDFVEKKLSQCILNKIRDKVGDGADGM